MSERLTGRVSKILVKKGYGFVAGMDNRDYFFHMKELDPSIIAFRNLPLNSVVSFVPAPAKAPGQCLQATKLELLSNPNAPLS